MGDAEQKQAEETQNEGEQAQAPEPQEQPAGEEVPPEGAEAKGEEGEGEEKPEGETEGEKSEAAKPDEKHKRQGGWQRKIDRLERQNQLLMEQLAAARPAQPPAGAAPGAEKTPQDKAHEYMRQVVRAELEAEREQARQAQAQAEFQRRYTEVRAAHPDFDDVVESVSHIPVSRPFQEALLTSPAGPEIMYQLASNPAELARVGALPPLDAAREIGRLEAKLASSTAAPKATRTATRPPAPPTTVNGSTSSTRSLEDLPLSEYKRAYRSGRR